MSIHDNIRFIREINQWSQEEMATKLHMSTGGYAKVERGETKLHIDKLTQIAQIFNMDVVDLIRMDETNRVFLMPDNKGCLGINYGNYGSIYQNTNGEVEKLTLIISHKDDIIARQTQELETLRATIALLENVLKNQNTQ